MQKVPKRIDKLCEDVLLYRNSVALIDYYHCKFLEQTQMDKETNGPKVEMLDRGLKSSVIGPIIWSFGPPTRTEKLFQLSQSMFESGIVEYDIYLCLNKRYQNMEGDEVKISNTNSGKIQPLSTEHLQSIFFAYAIGICACLITLAYEIISFK